MTEHMLTATADIRNYMFGCAESAVFTLVSMKTYSRFTYRLRRDKRKSKFFFVDGLTGEDNQFDYSFLGSVRFGYDAHGWSFNWSTKSHVPANASLVIAIDYFMALINYNRDLSPTKLEFWYSGHCSQCGRLLTVPESLARGMGPKCYARAQGML